MILMTLAGVEILLDFTAPAWLALLSLMLPRQALYRTAAACLLHETAHILAMRLLHRRPASLRISAAGLCLRMRGDALCPTVPMTLILLAGIAANGAAAAGLYLTGAKAAAYANLSLALLNLLPFPDTDGGTLLELLLSQRLLSAAPERIGRILLVTGAVTALLFAGLLYRAEIVNPSLWGMLVFLTGGQLVRSAGERKKHCPHSPVNTGGSIAKKSGL